KAATGNAIQIKGFAYSPATLKAKVGETITVTNEDSSVHTITASDKSFDSGDLAKGKAFTFTIKKAGSYDYICDIHQYMKGTITVS
ncbi:MAG: blue (type 1) copper domain protein, partial [Frankiales bacterium]|nr:blue (type 1) copper domain protein [Frankiales bacterium]